MPASQDNRPNPDELLGRIKAEESRAHRGRLKIFFGGCAGVGKTYAMLSAAHERLKEGVDVVIGIVETHSRPETEKLAAGIPVVPLLEIDHRGVKIKEFNLDAALSRKPALILLDELAHTNAPGVRHPKRWNDVEELLEAGIDVYTTLNVQHIESLNDIVAGITGVFVKETVPDKIFDQADDITLVDIPADELLKRLKEGKVYIAAQAKARAADNFFKKSNLIALRELALRRTAERVDAQMDDLKAREGLKEAITVGEKILVCIGPDPLSAKLVRSARRMASALRAPWVAVYVENARHYKLNQRGRKAVETIMRMVERNGGKTAVLQGNNAVEEIIAYAKEQEVTKIIVGKPHKTRLRNLVFGTLVDKIIRKTSDVDIYVITGDPVQQKTEKGKTSIFAEFRPNMYLWGLLSVTLCTGAAHLLGKYLAPVDQIMIYLMGVVIVAAKFGRGPSIVFSLLAITAFNFFFIEPGRGFNIHNPSYMLTFGVMVITSVVISTQALQLKMQAFFARRKERDTQSLYMLTKELASTRGHESISETAAKQIAENFDVDAVIWLAFGDDLKVIYGQLPEEDIKEETVARWAFTNGHVAGYGTATMPSAKGLYFPIVAASGILGVLGALPKVSERIFQPEEISLIETFASLLASALERASSAETAEKSRVEAESEKLRNILLSSVSHDLRTPLASITGASSSLLLDDKNLSPATQRELVKSINQEAARLSRIVTNLLDVTSLESGSIKLNKQPYYVQELIGSVLLRLEHQIEKYNVIIDVKHDLPLVFIDGVLIEQVLTNLLENAVKYTPENSTVKILAKKSHDDLVISIEDNGKGIPAGNESKIFDKFYTSEHKDKHKGSGLGLAICHGIIAAHHGKIWAENRPEGGARFSFTLPTVKSDVIAKDLE